MKRTWFIIAAVVLSLVACKGDKSKSGGSKKGGCELSVAKPAEIVAGKTPQLLAPFTALKLGMPLADVKVACANFFEGDDAKKTGTFTTGEIVGKFGDVLVYDRLDFIDDKLTAVSMSLPPDIADALTAAWSAPQASPGNPPAHAWHDDASGIRAILGPLDDGKRELLISSYVPLAAFVDPASSQLAMKPQDVLGKTAKELMEKFPQYVRPAHVSESTKAATEAMMADMKKEVEEMGVDTSHHGDDVDITLPATPFAAGTSTQALIHQNDDGTVRGFEVWFRTKSIGLIEIGWPAEITELVKLFDDKWGPSKKIKRVLGEESTWYDPKTGVRASAQLDPSNPDDLDVSYIRYQPLAAFFGEPGPVWGFEKPERPLLGATADELVAAYGSAVKIDTDNDTATLTLLPTDYDDGVATTTILMFIRGGKVGQWNVSLGFEAYEPSRAEYEALLAAKFAKSGPPKPGEYKGHMVYNKKPTVDAEFTDITHDLDLEVSQ